MFNHVLIYMWYHSLVTHFCDSPLTLFQNQRTLILKYSQFKNPNLKSRVYRLRFPFLCNMSLIVLNHKKSKNRNFKIIPIEEGFRY